MKALFTAALIAAATLTASPSAFAFSSSDFSGIAAHDGGSTVKLQVSDHPRRRAHRPAHNMRVVVPRGHAVRRAHGVRSSVHGMPKRVHQQPRRHRPNVH